jgi:hypothetical protein
MRSTARAGARFLLNSGDVSQQLGFKRLSHASTAPAIRKMRRKVSACAYRTMRSQFLLLRFPFS